MPERQSVCRARFATPKPRKNLFYRSRGQCIQHRPVASVGIGDGHEPYTEAMKACSFGHNGYVGRMQQYMGVAAKKEKKKRDRKKK